MSNSNFQIKEYNSQKIRIDPVTRYVCLTDMAKATGKLPADWLRLKSSQEYLAALSAVMGIPIRDNHAGSKSLLSVIQGIEVEQGTWAHPEVAIEFAAWCSIPFKIQVNSWINELLTAGRVDLIKPEKPKLKLVSKKSTVKQFVSTCNLLFNLVPNLDANRKATMILSAVSSTYPEHVEIAATAQAALPPVDSIEQSYTPTEIGAMLNPKVSAQRVNVLLESAGLQTSYLTARQQKKWKPTALGVMHSVLTIEAKHNGAPVESIRWKVSVSELLIIRVASSD